MGNKKALCEVITLVGTDKCCGYQMDLKMAVGITLQRSTHPVFVLFEIFWLLPFGKFVKKLFNLFRAKSSNIDLYKFFRSRSASRSIYT